MLPRRGLADDKESNPHRIIADVLLHVQNAGEPGAPRAADARSVKVLPVCRSRPAKVNGILFCVQPKVEVEFRIGHVLHGETRVAAVKQAGFKRAGGGRHHAGAITAAHVLRGLLAPTSTVPRVHRPVCWREGITVKLLGHQVVPGAWISSDANLRRGNSLSCHVCAGQGPLQTDVERLRL